MHGAFMSNKTGNPYPGIGLDHAHEQMNAVVKGDDGEIGQKTQVSFRGGWWPGHN